MDCPDCQELFSEYADRTLEQSLLPPLEAHLEDCPQCAKEWQYFMATIKWLKNMNVPAPDGLLEGIHRKIGTNRQTLHPLTRLFNFFKQGDFSFSMPAAAATLATAAVVMLLVKNFAPPELLSYLGGPQQPAVVAQSQPADPQEPSYATPANTLRQQAQPQIPVFSLADQDATPDLRQLGVRMVTTGNADLFGTYSPIDQPWLRGELSSRQFHSLILGHFPPDVRISLGNISDADRLALCRKLLNGQPWSAKIYSKDNILLYISPYELKNLHGLLAGYSPEIYPPAAKDAFFGSPKRVLTVALQLR